MSASSLTESALQVARQIVDGQREIQFALIYRISGQVTVELCPIFDDGTKDLIERRMLDIVRRGAEEIVTSTESWIAKIPREMLGRLPRPRVSELPNRREVVIVTAYRPDGEVNHMADIERDAGGKRRLAPWRVLPASYREGRFANIFSRGRSGLQ